MSKFTASPGEHSPLLGLSIQKTLAVACLGLAATVVASSARAQESDPTGLPGQALSLPSGAGSVEGMGDSFQPLLSVGQARYGVPLQLQPGRGRAQPSASLAYSSGAGISTTGLGWSLSVPAISRQTAKGAPRYQPDSLDRFVFNGTQELVPIAATGGPALPDDEAWPEFVTSSGTDWTYFRARSEGAFHRFFLRADQQQWVVQDTNGTLTFFGLVDGDVDSAGALVDFVEDDRQYVYRWNLSRVVDRSGNTVLYRHSRHDGQSYLQAIYWNSPLDGSVGDDSYQHAALFEYEARPDVTFSYASGFRIGTGLRLAGVHLSSVPWGQAPGSVREHVRSYSLGYDPDSYWSLLSSVQLHGKGCGDAVSPGCTVAEGGSLPPLQFGYTEVASGQAVDGFGLVNDVPVTLSSSPRDPLKHQESELFDANKDGLPDLLVTNNSVYHREGHKLYLNQLNAEGTPGFGRPRLVSCAESVRDGSCESAESLLSLGHWSVHALDVNADAEVELLSLIGTRNRYSYYSLESRADGDTEELVWEQHGPFQHEGSELNLADEWRYIAPVDANNDKLVDMVVNQGGPVRTYLNLGRCPGGQGKFGTPVYDEWGRCVAFNEEPIVSCSLYTGSGAVSFRDPGFRVADMNGDGRADLVKIQSDGLAYRLWYWPGRGNGLWGAGDRDCHSGADNEIIMDGSVGTYNRRRTSHLADVNGDGAADFIVASPGGWNRISVEVWLNRGGLSWSEPMYTRIPGASWDAELVRLADLDGSGTRDLVVGTPDSYQYIDFMGGRTPRLLHLIDNGLGGVTEIEYSSSTPYMLADRERSEAWTSTLPLAVNVVSRSVISDGQGARYVKDYAYRDPYYDSLDGRFRGFSQALVRSWGDESTPTQVQHSSFHLGERPSWLCANEATREDGSGDLECALADNPYETLGGRPYLAETRTDPEPDGDSWWTAPSAQFLQTVHTSYRVDQLFEGLDGRGVWYAWSPQQDTFAYGSQSARADESLTLPGVELRRRTAEDGADGSVVDQMDGQITLRTGTSGRAHRRARRNQDRFGRTLWQAHDGLVGYSGDERMSHQVWGYNQAAWIHRPCEGWIEGGEHDVDTRLAYTQTFYEGHENHLCEVGDRGLITFARTQLVTRQADGTAMSPRWIPQGLTDYNAQGLPANTYGGVGPGDEANALRHQRNTYDAQYGALLVAEQVQANRADQDAAYLTNSAVWDVGLGLPTAVTEHNGQTGYAQYDALGRVTAVYRPLCREPAAVYEYVISESGGLHYVHTQANEVCDSPGNPSPEEGEAAFTELNTSTGVTESYGFVDGLGRPRAALAEGDADDGFAWVLTGVVDFDARGNVRRAYDPVPLETAAEPWRLVTLTGLEVPYEERGYDPFGRPIWTTATDGSLSSRMEYGANWSHHWDGNDLDSRSRHHNTYETALVDGLGRTVVSLSRLAGDEGVTLHAATSVYDGLGNVVTVTRGEAVADSVAMGAPSVAFVDGRSTTRAILYDSLGQKTHNVDPDSGTSLYFYDRLGQLTRMVDARGVQSMSVHDLAGRVVAVDEYGDGASWAAMNSTTGHSTDDDVDLARLAELTGELFAYEYDLDNDFLPERGADVLFGYDSAYVVDSGLCRTAPNLEQAYLLGRISWVRDASGCSWSSYDERGRSTWSARQLDPGEQVFVTAASYDGVAGPDDLDRLRSETYPDGTSVHYDFSQRGLLKSVTGQAPNADSLFAGRTFADDIRHDEFGQRTSWLLGDSSGNQVRTDYQYNVRRRLESMTSQLSGPDGTDMALARNRYYYDQVGNVRSLADNRTLAETADWSPEPVSYRYTYDSLYRLTRATPWYRSVPRLGFAGLGSWWLKALKRRVGRAGDQEWSHDALGSMRTWTAENWGDGDHFYEWGLGTIINGQQLIAADAGTGVSSRCATVPEAAARVSGPAPHALYFAYEAKESDGEYNGLEACYDAAGNMVALYRLNLAECGAEPLSEATADWNCASQTVVWDLQLLWDAAGRLSRVEKLGDEGVTDIRHVYDATGTRALRLDHESTEGSEQATLFLSPAYEIRDATVDTDGSYYGGEETKYVFAGDQRIARVVEQVADGVAEWPNAPGRAHVFHTLTNHLGSASVTFDGESIPGQNPVVVAQTQLAYGAEDDRVDNPVYGGWRPNYEFTGKEEDPDVGLMYFGARFYGAGMGRFISADPLAVHGLGADLNQYRYVRANPLLLVDPSGLDGEQSNVITSMPDGASCPETNPSGSEAGQLPIHRYDGEWNLQSTNPEHTCLYGEGGQFYGDNVDFTSDPIERVAGSAPEGGGILGSVAEALNPVTPMISPVIRSQYGIPADSGASWGLQGMDALERSASMVAQRGATASEGAAFWFDRVTTVASFAAEAALGSIGASGLARGGGAGVRLATRGGGKMRVPWKFGSPSGGARGSTDAYGNITIRRGLSGRELTETVRHEAVHRFFSPTRPGRFQVARARLGMWGYKNSAFLKYTEEALAEGIATRSVSQGLLFPITHGYVHPARLAIETGALGGAGYGLYSLHK